MRTKQGMGAAGGIQRYPLTDVGIKSNPADAVIQAFTLLAVIKISQEVNCLTSWSGFTNILLCCLSPSIARLHNLYIDVATPFQSLKPTVDDLPVTSEKLKQLTTIKDATFVLGAGQTIQGKRICCHLVLWNAWVTTLRNMEE